MPLVGGFGCLELVLYGIRELAWQHYEPLILLQSEIYNTLPAYIEGDGSPLTGQHSPDKAGLGPAAHSSCPRRFGETSVAVQSRSRGY